MAKNKNKVENNNQLSLINSIIGVVAIVTYQVNVAMIAIAGASVLEGEVIAKSVQNLVNFVIENSVTCAIIGAIYMIFNFLFAKKNKKVSIALTVIGSLIVIANIIYCISLFNV